MDEKKQLPRLSLFHPRLKDLGAYGTFTEADFEGATSAEKASMVETHKSVSYWADAARRFKKNTVSMIALVVVIIILLFAFVGPTLIPYSYEEQYRSAMKLGPFEYSQGEQFVKDLIDKEGAELVYASSMQQGSVTSLKKGNYFFQYKGSYYIVHLQETMRGGALIYDADAAEPLYAIDEEAYLASGELIIMQSVPFDVQKAAPTLESLGNKRLDTLADGKLSMLPSVFPHVFGTDSAGRDIMARCMYGARVSLLIGIIASLIVLIIGAIYGSIAGLCGGVIDFVMMRIVDLIYSVPDVLIVLLLQVVLQTPLQNWFDSSSLTVVKALGTLGVGIVSIFITFALLYWVGMARIVRGQVLMLKQQEYVTAATVLGAPNSRIIKRHLLPNCVGQIVIATCLQIPSAIFLESFLSFLGLGISAPMSSLGSMCADAIATITAFPYRLLFPAIILSLLVLSLNLVGDGLRDALDPRLKK